MENQYDIQSGNKNKKSKKKLWITLSVILAVILIFTATGWIIVDSYLSKINYAESMGGGTSSLIDDDDVDPTVSDSPQSEIDSMLNEIRDNASAEYELMYDDDVLNVLFIGSDARFTGQGARSDAMILASINKRTQKIVATSFLRDSYVSIPGKGENRLNAAYAFGGTELLFETIEQNFKIKVDKFVQVDFETFVEVIDAINGVTITVTQAEAERINRSVRDLTTWVYKEPDAGNDLPGAGTYRLNGDQALAYARIRKLDGDRMRAQRQRTVLEAIYKEAKQLSYTELNNLANRILPLVNTNVSKREIILLMLRMPELLSYDTDQYTMPADGTYKYVTIDRRAVTAVNFEKNIALLRKNIYGWE